MNGTYVCWQMAGPQNDWAILFVGADGDRRIVSRFSHYPDAVRALRGLRATGAA